MRKIPRRTLRRAKRLLLPGIHQGSSKTGFDRYPEIFSGAAAALPEARRILSFGCSTGEECVTLHKYFPQAEIVGADINPLNVWRARRHASDKVRFVYARDRALSSRGLFDVIFCLTVLRDSRLDDDSSIRESYPFERFDERVRFLHSLLRSAGLLVFYGNMYRFRDSSVAHDYEVIPLKHTPVGENITFARDGSNDGAQYLDVLFRKKAAHTGSSADVATATP
ncbi:class I SAM-dependent methyltransferase [Methyloceanibacter sp.]|uniref:class I SAM-dependent methyltransferase n=1 Tax=Methyloceanibacter sp. TaxID=1965321 RepID=UPI003D6D2991